ncbi:MAG: hypothetical protein JJ992_00040, partial [Planctomycetes bacterium]|nr:hypothetical protein [Planctomycetota bacterium]
QAGSRFMAKAAYKALTGRYYRWNWAKTFKPCPLAVQGRRRRTWCSPATASRLPNRDMTITPDWT